MANPSPGPEAILHVSLPAGVYVGPHVDPWLSEGWLLNITGVSATFNLIIEDVSGNITSYDTRLVIALNDAAYTNIESLTVDTITIQQEDFRYGTPRPYDLWDWPSGDVYPTWFNDTLVNVGRIQPKNYTEVTVSVTFSNATGARMHFDAYGSSVDPAPPPTKGKITHNPLSNDSTVVFRGIPPYCEFDYDPQWPNVNVMVNFNASASYDPDGYMVSYTWNFGDSTPQIVGADPFTNHTYTTFGNYTVTLTVMDNDNLTHLCNKTVWVRQHPVADFIWSSIRGAEPASPWVSDTVTFDASTSTPDGGYLKDPDGYAWDFDGDGSIDDYGKIVDHNYTEENTYTVTLNVTDSEGEWDTESKNVTVILPSVGSAIDVYTQKDPYSGKGLDEESDAFAPQEEVILYAYVSYYCDPVQGKLVAFEVYDSNRTAILYRTDDSDENGIAAITFRISSTPLFGTWTVYATVSLAGVEVKDTLTFQVGWIVEIVRVETVDINGLPKTSFAKGEQVYVNMILQNIAKVPKIVALTLVIYDEASFPVGQVALQNLIVNPGSNNVTFSLTIPNWAFVGVGTIHVNAYTDMPQLNGTPYSPELSTTFIITKP